MQLIYFMSESLAPEKFARILNPADARYELERHYLFGGSSMSSISSRHIITRNTQSGIGVSSYREDSGMKRGVFDELKRGSLLAVDASIGAWSPVKYPFFINAQGHLQRYYGTVLPPQYPVERIIQRYEEMISRYAARPKPTSLPPRQNTAKNPPLMQAVAAAVGSSLTVIKEIVRPMSKQERWQARKYLIGRGERSIYPDARIAAQRLAQNNVAVEKAKLAQNVYNTTNPLAATPGVPEGWRDVSNDGGFLDKLELRKDMLFDNEIEANFLSRIYAPDRAVFGDDMNPTVVFRGSRMPELPNGKLNAAKKLFIDRELPEIKNLEDWTNNFNQGRGADSEYYKKAVAIGKRLGGSTTKIDISGHSLGGGLASAASIASGKPGWTFNAAGLNSGTVEKYGGSLVGREDIINAYRVKGEVLTRLQEVDLRQDFIDVNGNLALLAAKEKISSHLPDAVGVKHTLDGGVGNMGDRHGIQQVIDCIEQEKDDDIATIGHRI